MIESLTTTEHSHAVYAKAQLDASQKHLWDCKEREKLTWEAYRAAVAATTQAHRLERAAFEAWFSATRPRYQDIEHTS